MRKRKRNLLILILVFVLLLSIFSVSAYTKQGMMTVVRLGEEQLTTLAKEWISDGNGEEYLPSKYSAFGYRIDVCPSSGCVFFKHYTFKETGFYYSTDGEPVGYLGNAVVFEEYGDGWIWEEGIGSDNWFYTEHIAGNWYWYEMHY